MPSASTIDLVQRAQRGDQEAFCELVEAWAGPVRCIALAASPDARTAEDLAQTTFLEAWRRLHQLRDPAAFGGWLRRIARSACRDAARRRAVRPDLGLPGTPVVAPVSDSPEYRAEEHQAQRRLLAALAAMDESEREVLLLYHLEDRTTAELAVGLGRSEAAVRQRLSRARKALSAGLTASLTAWLAHVRLDPAFAERMGRRLRSSAARRSTGTRPGIPQLVATVVLAASVVVSFGVVTALEGASSAGPVSQVAERDVDGAPERRSTDRPSSSVAHRAAGALPAAGPPDLEDAIAVSLDGFPEDVLEWSHPDVECEDGDQTCAVWVDVGALEDAPAFMLHLMRGIATAGVKVDQFHPLLTQAPPTMGARPVIASESGCRRFPKNRPSHRSVLSSGSGSRTSGSSSVWSRNGLPRTRP